MPITKTYYKVHRCFPDPDYFYLENISGSTTQFMVVKKGTPASTDLAYSLDKVTWTDIHNGGTISNVANNAKVYFRSTTGFSTGESNGYRFISGDGNTKGPSFNAGGHIATLFNYLNVEGVTEIPVGGLYNLFAPLTCSIVHANIDFYGIKTIKQYGCAQMFNGRSDLITIPDFSSVETLEGYSLYYTFTNCSALTTPADLSNVTSWDVASMRYLYSGCSSLTEAIAPNISSWRQDFSYNWLENTAATGVVRKPAGLTITADSASGVPTGWTTEDY